MKMRPSRATASWSSPSRARWWRSGTRPAPAPTTPCPTCRWPWSPNDTWPREPKPTDAFSTNQTGTLAASDVEGTTLTYGISNGTTGGTVGATTYDVSKTGSYGTLYLLSTTGAYVYVPNAGAINALTANATETFTLTTSDGGLLYYFLIDLALRFWRGSLFSWASSMELSSISASASLLS